MKTPEELTASLSDLRTHKHVIGEAAPLPGSFLFGYCAGPKLRIPPNVVDSTFGPLPASVAHIRRDGPLIESDFESNFFASSIYQ